MDRDANRQVITSFEAFRSTKSMTFDGGTTNDPGDENGTGNPATLFTVTGDVIITLTSTCQTSLEGGSATLKVGISDISNGILTSITATFYDADHSWSETGGTNTVINADPGGANSGVKLIAGGQDIIQTVGAANITAGAITYYCFWRPLSSDGNIVAA